MNAASPKPFSAPVVDHLSVRVVVDSRYEHFMPKETHPQVKIEHVGGISGRPMTTLAGADSKSLRAGETHSTTPDAWARIVRINSTLIPISASLFFH